jgi:hypothetical protein
MMVSNSYAQCLMLPFMMAKNMQYSNIQFN